MPLISISILIAIFSAFNLWSGLARGTVFLRTEYVQREENTFSFCMMFATYLAMLLLSVIVITIML